MTLDYNDLSNVGSKTRESFEGEMAIRQKYRHYYTGEVFETRQAQEPGSDEEAPLLYPVGVNLVKMICEAMADSEFGEWSDDIFTFQPRQDTEIRAAELDAAVIAQNILRNSNANVLFWENSLDRQTYGGGAIKILPDVSRPGRIRWTRVPLDNFFPVWDPEDIDNLLEVYIIYEITKDQAEAKYRIKAEKDQVKCIEHWTLQKYTFTVDGKRVDAYSGVNPWGMIPFEFIPRFRSTHWWGDALTESIIPVQDELNMRLADLGEAVNYSAHPIKWGLNMPQSFNAKNYPIGPSFLWDLGRVIGQSPKPEVGVLEAKNPIPQGTERYIQFLYDWARTSSFAPPIAFGDDDGGSQRSGITLEIKMWPLIKSIRRSRAYLSGALVRAMQKSGRILRQKQLPGISIRGVDVLIEGALVPTYASILPRDQAALVDEIQKGMSTTPPTISLPTAVKKLGYGISEEERIKKMLADDELYKREEKKQEPKSMDSAGGAAPEKAEKSSE